MAAPHVLADRSFEALTDPDEEFVHEFGAAKDTVLRIERKVVEGIRLEGPEGYTAFLVRSRARTGARTPEELLTILVAGQYRLIGYDKHANTLYACRIRLFERRLWISAILAFRNPYHPATPVGPPGRYQYASASANGDSLVLVDQDVTLVDLTDGQWKKMGVDPPLSMDAANPASSDRPAVYGVNLDGTFVEMRWRGGRSGSLHVRNAEGPAGREIKIENPDR